MSIWKAFNQIGKVNNLLDAAVASDRARLTILENSDSYLIHLNEEAELTALSSKTSPVNSDCLLIEDSEASYAKKKLLLSNLPGGSDPNAVHLNQAGEVDTLDSKAEPVDADLILIEDSEASYAKKKLLLQNIPGGSDPNAVHVNAANEISGISEKSSPVDDDLLVIEDSAASYVKKKLKISNLPSGGSSIEFRAGTKTLTVGRAWQSETWSEMSGVPIVVATFVGNEDGEKVSVRNVTTTGCDIAAFSPGDVNWLAIYIPS